MASQAFKIDMPEERLQWTIDRVRGFTFPANSEDAGWSFGLEQNYMQELVAHWLTRFNWRNHEQHLNETPQFLARRNGRALHFARLNPGGGVPIVLLHGWPYSFATMLPLAERLAKSFDVIVPSLPGFVFSDPCEPRASGARRLSAEIHWLMADVLGFDRYVVHGGDVGAEIADWLAVERPRSVRGTHTHYLYLRHHGAAFGSGHAGSDDATPEETEFARREAEVLQREGAYYSLQVTRPETIAPALCDSPVGWAVYMLDKWHKWSDLRHRSFADLYSMDLLLTEVMLYILTDSVATSLWVYPGYAAEPTTLPPGDSVKVPLGYSSFRDPLIANVPRRFAERSRSDIRFWREHESGGHFPMLEATEALAADIVDFVNTLDQ